MKTELGSTSLGSTTEFLNDGTEKVAKRVQLSRIPEGLNKASQVGYNQEIKDFLAKPVILDSVLWTTETAGDVLTTKIIPKDALANNVYLRKITGFRAFKATAVLKLQINANKFQAGRALMVFIPQGGIDNVFSGMRTRSLLALTQLPRIELDLASETEVTLEVPYISPTPYYDLVTEEGSAGRVSVYVYSAIATGTGSQNVEMTLWVSFKDVELITPVWKAEMGRPKGRNVSEMEAEASGDKPISSGLRKLSAVASSFAAVPMLSDIAGPAAWVTNCMAGIAAAFGYSKPSSETATSKTMITQTPNMHNADGMDMLPVMGVSGSNKLSVLSGFAGTDLDEMTLSHLFQIPAYQDHYTWSTSDMSGTPLMGVGMGADQYIQTGIQAVVLTPWKDMNPVSYFSQFFAYWRGSIVVTFKIVKTSFHSGRLLFAYNPDAGTSSSWDITNSNYMLREIMDIRENVEYKFVLPFVATQQYLKYGEICGYFKLFVLNPLVAPDTVASTVDIIMEISGGEDFEVMCPNNVTNVPVGDSTWVAQMGVSEDTPAEPVGIGSSNIERHDLDPAAYCVGEKVNSILQLMKRFSVLTWDGANTPVYTFDFRLFTMQMPDITLPFATSTTPSRDYYSYFGPCYAYARGSMRVMVSPRSDTVNNGRITIAYYSTNTSILSSASIVGSLTATNYLGGSTSQCVLGGQVPAYQQYHTRLNRVGIGAAVEPVDSYGSAMRIHVLTNGADGSPIITNHFRAAGDDFMLGYFLGTPRMTNY